MLGEETSRNPQAYRRGHLDITILNKIRAAKERKQNNKNITYLRTVSTVEARVTNEPWRFLTDVLKDITVVLLDNCYVTCIRNSVMAEYFNQNTKYYRVKLPQPLQEQRWLDKKWLYILPTNLATLENQLVLFSFCQNYRHKTECGTQW